MFPAVRSNARRRTPTCRVLLERLVWFLESSVELCRGRAQTTLQRLSRSQLGLHSCSQVFTPSRRPDDNAACPSNWSKDSLVVPDRDKLLSTSMTSDPLLPRRLHPEALDLTKTATEKERRSERDGDRLNLRALLKHVHTT